MAIPSKNVEGEGYEKFEFPRPRSTNILFSRPIYNKMVFLIPSNFTPLPIQNDQNLDLLYNNIQNFIPYTKITSSRPLYKAEFYPRSYNKMAFSIPPLQK